MPNVLHVIDADTPRDALDQLALLADERGQIVSIGPPPNTRRDLTVASVRRPLGSAVLAAHDLRRVALEPDVVHAWSPAAAQAARRAARAAGCGLVISLVTGRAVEAGSLGPLFKRLCTGRQRATLTVPTEHSRRVLLNRGLPAEAAAVLPPAAEPIGDRDARRRRTREQLGLGNRAVLLVAPAQMTRWAGHKYAAWVHGILRQIVDHVRLMLPGSGPVAQHVRFFANTTGYDDEVFFTGDRVELSDALAAADVAVFFQQRDCGVGSLAAAMAAGLPVVASATGDVRALIRDGETGLLTARSRPREQTAAVLRLIDEPALAQRLGAAAADFARRHFRPEQIRARLERIHASASGS